MRRRNGVAEPALLIRDRSKIWMCSIVRGVRDFDLLQQIDPSWRVMFYKIGTQ